MKDLEVYTAILRRARSEHPGIDDLAPGSVLYTDTADSLGDTLYRLCIEYGASFNDFKRAVLEEVPHRGTHDGNVPEPARALLAELVAQSDLVVLALELMRDDPAY